MTLNPETQPVLEIKKGAGERNRSGTLKTAVILTNIKFNLRELARICNKTKHKRELLEKPTY